MKRFFSFTLIGSLAIIFLLSGCKADPQKEVEQTVVPETIQDTLHLATDGSMSYVVQVLAQIFTLDYPMPYQVHTLSSRAVAKQIQKDTVFDFLFSTDQVLLDSLYQLGLSPDKPVDLAYGKLVLWTTQSGFMPDLVALRSPTINQVALPDPAKNAYGKTALSILKKEQMMDLLDSRLVYPIDLKETNRLITNGDISIGFTSKSMVLTPEYTEVGSWVEVDDRLYDPVPHQFIRLNQTSAGHPRATTFEDFLKSQRVKDVLANFGYLPNGLLGNN